MELEHSFTVPAGIEQAWATLLDVERIAPCMPGATLQTVEGDEFTGTVKVKVGPVTISYGGQARFRDRDDQAHSVVIEASGKESRGSGTASATVLTKLEQLGEQQTRVVVSTDLSITGKPAQFGRGVINDVGNKIIGQFADCLAQRMAEPAGTQASGPAEPTGDAAGGAAVGTAGTAGGAAVGTVGAAAGGPAGPAAAGGPAGAAAGGPAGPAAAGAGESGGAPSAAAGAGGAGGAPSWSPPSAEPINLFETAGMPVLKRLAPALGGVVLLVLIWKLLHRRRG